VTLANTKRLQWRYCHEDGNNGGYGLGAGNSAMVMVMMYGDYLRIAKSQKCVNV